MKWDYKEKCSFEKRLKEAQEILKKYPERIPIIIERRKSSSFWQRDSKLPDLDKSKFLVPKDLTIGQFFLMIRQKLKNIRPEEALYFFIDTKMPLLSATLGSIYKEHHDEDQFLYISYSEEATFG